MRIQIIQAREGRLYITPTTNKVTGLLVGDGTENFGTLQRINKTYPLYMAL